MLAILQKDWGSLPADRQISLLKKLKPDMLCEFVRRIDPKTADISVLRWIAARQEIDLATALSLFCAFDPRNVNLVPKDALPQDTRARSAVIDVLCQRINCGFYVPIASRKVVNPSAIVDWLRNQQEDRKAGRCGRWILDPSILSPIMCDRPIRARTRARAGLIQGLFTPLYVSSR